jgi:hypothetical protein
MSGKQEKRLRQMAKGLAVSVDQGGRQIHERGLIETKHTLPNPDVYSDGTRSVVLDDTMNFQPRARVQEYVYAVTVKNRPDSLRDIIRTLKNGIKNGVIGKIPTGFKAP